VSTNVDSGLQPKVYTTPDGHVAIEQSNQSVVISPEQILRVIRELHVCYDYCAAWKEPAGEDNPVGEGISQ
jgi:hypothetical protein